ncbi:MAG TPA: double zinc ribbon domain-containing protein [Pyrinomonadaceae bacterium]|nr:double zinc ribbon domain-containing protein [Pyrinomonadaceae bacterium]
MLLTETITQLCDSALALVYPQPCHVCGHSVESRADGFVCNDCWVSTRIFSAADPLCWKCGALAAGNIGAEAREQVRCQSCELHAFTGARACGVYEKALRAAVLSLKRQPYVPSRLAELLGAAARRAPLRQCTRIVPIPLHPRRQRARGFNQAETISAELARRSGLPLDSVNLFRTVHTERHRAGMDARSRRETVEQAFAVRSPRLFAGQSILLVDDVFTSGATASACAATLLQCGAKAVFVLTIARTVHY